MIVRRVRLLATMLIFAAFGVIFLWRSFAAGPVETLQPEQGSRSGNVAEISDANASGGKAVRFGTVSSGVPSLLEPDGLGFAPYAYVAWGAVNMRQTQIATGVQYYTAAFIQSAGGCTPAWDGESSMGLNSSRSSTIANDINAVRAAGGDVIVSFGGAAGTDLAVSCTDVNALTKAYQDVVDRYNLTRIDFDVEGQQASNAAANLRRAQAIVKLQQANPNLKVRFTLSVMPSGLETVGKNILTQLRDNGVKLAGVNIMIMDYGIGSKDMAQDSIKAADATFSNLKTIYGSGYSDAVIWKTIGLIPMIGINDTMPETFTLANAQTIRNYAAQKGIGMLSMWEVNRDKSCSGNAAILSDSCSGVVQSPYQFMSILSMPPF